MKLNVDFVDGALRLVLLLLLLLLLLHPHANCLPYQTAQIDNAIHHCQLIPSALSCTIKAAACASVGG